MNWYVAIRRMREPPASFASRLDAHLTWLKAMHEQGTIIMSGPSTDLSLGIYVMRARNTAEAGRLASADPLLKSPGATLEVTEWQLHQILGVGAFSVSAS
ncbi:MAG TPA: YciI family protein [Streptosporangiaceae bacterium]